MHKLVVCVLLVAAGSLAAADTREDDYHGQAFAQFGVGACSVGVQHYFQGGCGAIGNLIGGGEGFVYRGLAIGGEGGWAWINDGFKEGVGVISVNPSYHFKGSPRFRALVPFVTGGYTALFRGGSLSGFNVGGGATWWASRHVGLRFEGRLHHFDAGPLGANVFLFRLGGAFR